jgi:Ser/Thr protein kinase RdoA (MazF antagonist)
MRLQFDVGRIMAETEDDPLGRVRAMEAMQFLADDLNARLDGYEVSLVHHDCEDYLVFERNEPEQQAMGLSMIKVAGGA